MIGQSKVNLRLIYKILFKVMFHLQVSCLFFCISILSVGEAIFKHMFRREFLTLENSCWRSSLEAYVPL
jgi:hypothetical protein